VTVIRRPERYPTLYSRHVTDSIEGVLRRFVVTWFFNIVALWVAAKLLDGIGYSDNEWVLVIAALVFSLANIFVKPLVILFTLPLVILTLGLALFFVNLLMLYLTSWVVDDFRVESFGAAIVATIIIWLVNTVLEAVFSRDERDRELAARRYAA
jgi:putative membrane protein